MLDTHYAYLDLEVDADDQIFRFGLVSTDGEWDVGATEAAVIQTQLMQLQQPDRGLCGHNIRRFDWPYLMRQWPDLEAILVIDTLELSVLAFPLHPSHKLQKDYKLSDYASNHPLEDARATRLLLQQILDRLSQQPESLQAAYRWLLTCGAESSDRAYQQLFERLHQSIAPVSLEVLPEAAIAAMDRVYLEHLWPTIADFSFGDRLSLAALLAWNHERTLTQSKQSPSGWLQHIPNFLQLRSQLFPLFEVGFTYQPYLQEFNIPGFRELQEAAVQASIEGENPLILMPTGGGKSLCYQLPALMFYRRQQGLTICISPLQALMEDQVADLETAGLDFATYINGTLSAEERSHRIAQIRDGWKGLLYISPEQLRSVGIRVLLQERLPVLWVIDEAHCISQWGHDFRPDYCYVPKFIQTLYQERQHPLPRLALLTATATAEVRADIQALFSEHGLVIQQEIRGEVQRDNLLFDVHRVGGSDKDKVLRSLLQPFQKSVGSQNGCALIYTTTRKEAERLAEMLNTHNNGQDFDARYYHGKLSRDEKTEVLKAFKDGHLNVVTATCAFGMGINRKDVRTVIHHTMSSSLESYIQEAGRAGRDRELANCVLLFHEQDADTIFFLKSLNQLTRLELRSMLKSIRVLRNRILKVTSGAKEGADSWFWVTPNEIFQSSDLDDTFASEDEQRDTKIKVALHYLEQFGLVERAENSSSIVQFSLLQSSPLAACRQLKQYGRQHDFSEVQTEQFRRLIDAMFLANARYQQQEQPYPLERLSDESGIPIQELTNRIRELQQAGICSSKIPVNLSITKGVTGDARNKHTRLRELEQEFLEELLPLMGAENQAQINLRGMATRLAPRIADAKIANATQLMAILAGWQMLKWVQWQSINGSIVRLQNLEATEWLERHQTLSRTVIEVLYTDLGRQRGTQLPLDYDLGELLLKIQQRTKPLSWSELDIKTILFWLHHHQILRLTEGLSLFHQSFKLRTLIEERLPGERQDKGINTVDRKYETVQDRYDEQARRTHLMVEYGRTGDEVSRNTLVTDYFSLPAEEFASAYPHLVSDAVKRPVTQEDYDRIMLPLNPDQTAIVEADDPAMVVIAGPGSGKTRTIVHRIAYLVKVKRINPDRILVLAYNRNAIRSLRLRLQALIGSLAFYLRVFTFHGLALALLGRVLGTEQPGSKINFDQLLKDAIALLVSANDPDNIESQTQVVKLLGNVEYVFVDEYQDVGDDAYQLIDQLSKLGRSEGDPRSVQTNLCVIGDDDQTINEFAGANSRYIRDFEIKYSAKRFSLTENYRSTESIIAVTNNLIQHNQNRCKRTPEEQVRINHERKGEAGKSVQVLQFGDVASQAGWICEQVQSWLNAGIAANEIAILAHQWKLLSPVRSLLEQAHISTCALKNDGIPLIRNRVTYKLIERLKDAGMSRVLEPHELVRDRFWQQFQHWRRHESEPTVQTLLKIAESLDVERMADDPDDRSPISADEILTTLFEFNQSGTRFAQEDAVLVTSCHGAKGLEFRKVIVLTDGFESRPDQLEAERRLLYVAMTRAEEELILCGTQANRLLQDIGITPTPMRDRRHSLPQRLLYLDFTPKDVQLGHRATQDNQSVITALHEGEALQLTPNRYKDGWILRAQSGQAIGALSRNAVSELQRHQILPGQFQFLPNEVTVRYIYRHLKTDEVTNEPVEDWFVIIPQIRVCR